MSIEDEIKQERKPLPPWKALETLDAIANHIASGRAWIQAETRFQEVPKHEPKAKVRPPLDVAAGDYSYMDIVDSGMREVLQGRVGTWDGFKFKGTELGKTTIPMTVNVGKHERAMLGALKALEKLKQRGGNSGAT